MGRDVCPFEPRMAAVSTRKPRKSQSANGGSEHTNAEKKLKKGEEEKGVGVVRVRYDKGTDEMSVAPVPHVPESVVHRLGAEETASWSVSSPGPGAYVSLRTRT
jgi:hypothetical protein